MKTIVSLFLASYACTALSQSQILDYAVFSKENITYARSDFEGAVAAGKTISVSDFFFVSSVKAGEWFKQMRGQVHSNVTAGNTIQLSNVNVRSSLTGAFVYLNETSVSGTIKANYLNITTGYMGYPTSSHGGHKKISIKEAENRALNLKTEISALGYDLDLLSNGCRVLSGQEITDHNGTIVLSSSENKAVFHLSSATLMSASAVEFVVPSTSTVIVNISGKDLRIENLGIRLNGLSPRKLIWNIYEAERLNLSHSGSAEIYLEREVGLPGTFLAPLAKTTFTEAVITGSLMVKDLDGDEIGRNGGQVNDGLFNGESCRPIIRGKN